MHRRHARETPNRSPRRDTVDLGAVRTRGQLHVINLAVGAELIIR